MYLITIISTALCFLSAFACSAYSTDTLRSDEMKEITTGYQNSPFYNFNKFLFYSKSGDSINASKYLLKTDPYYLIWEWEKSQQPDTILRKYVLTKEAKISVSKAYIKTVNESKQNTYVILEKMVHEDQTTRAFLSKCGDTIFCNILHERMRVEDSIHATYLYDLVVKKGWPSIEEGSLFATLLALHDHKRHSFYITFLKAAVKKGQADLNALELMNNFLTRISLSTELLLKTIHQKNAIWFDISSMLNGKLPNNVAQISRTVRRLCKSNFKYYYIFASPNGKDMTIWADIIGETSNPIEILQAELKLDCPKTFFAPEVWEVKHIPSEKISMHLILITDNSKR